MPDGSRIAVAEDLRHGLSDYGFTLRADKGSSFTLKARRCRLTLQFERYPEGEDPFLLFIAPDSGPADRLHYWILRQVFGARDEGSGSPAQRCANVLRTYFADMLSGDFRRAKLYDQYESRILDGLEKVRMRPANDPIHDKIRAFDITWVEDVER